MNHNGVLIEDINHVHCVQGQTEMNMCFIHIPKNSGLQKNVHLEQTLMALKVIVFHAEAAVITQLIIL